MSFLVFWVSSQQACPLCLLLPGLSGDDFPAIGLCRGRVVYSYNLGSASSVKQQSLGSESWNPHGPFGEVLPGGLAEGTDSPLHLSHHLTECC